MVLDMVCYFYTWMEYLMYLWSTTIYRKCCPFCDMTSVWNAVIFPAIVLDWDICCQRSYIAADLTYLTAIVGVMVMFLFMPVQTYCYKRDKMRQPNQRGRPEARIITSLVTVWLYPISLFWFAFTSNGKTSYWSPIIAGGVLFFVDPLLYLGMLNYITGK